MIETNRLALRRLKCEDTEALYKIRHSEFVMKYNAMGNLSYEEMASEIQKECTRDDVWCMEIKASQKVIGVIYLHEDSLRYETNTKELSYWMCEEESGKGFMSEALNAIIHKVFYEEKLSGITARCFDENIASRKLLEKLGFTCEGILKNAVKGYQDVIYSDLLYYLENKNE